MHSFLHCVPGSRRTGAWVCLPDTVGEAGFTQFSSLHPKPRCLGTWVFSLACAGEIGLT